MHAMLSRLSGFVAVAVFGVLHGTAVHAQPPGWGPTTTVNGPAAASWPARPPTRIYVLPFPMEPGLEQQIQQSSGGVLPQGPVRQLFTGRPRVADMVTGFDRQKPVGTSIAKQVADALAQAGLPVVFWDQPVPPPADGWQLRGEVVSLSEGSAAARGIIGFGAGNATIGVDAWMGDPTIAGGQPFFVLDTSDRGRKTPGGVAMGAVTGFNPYVMVGRAAASASGVNDITQQSRISGSLATAVTDAMRQHGQLPTR
jgi:hypothetical protein